VHVDAFPAILTHLPRVVEMAHHEVAILDELAPVTLR